MVEHRSPKPGAGGSSPSTPAMLVFYRHFHYNLIQIADESVLDRHIDFCCSFLRKYFMADHTKTPLTKKIPEFFAQVRQEMRKVTWPSGKETRVTTVVVFIFAIIAAAYFMVVDQVIYRLLHLIIG